MKKIYLLLTIGVFTTAVSASAKDDHGHQKSGAYDHNTRQRYDLKNAKNGKAYGPYDNPGRGNKYGLFKVKKDKSQKAYKNRGKK